MILQTIIITWRIARENDKKLINFDILHNIILSSYDLLVRVICQFIIKLTFVVIIIRRNHYPLSSKSVGLFLFIPGNQTNDTKFNILLNYYTINWKITMLSEQF